MRTGWFLRWLMPRCRLPSCAGGWWGDVPPSWRGQHSTDAQPERSPRGRPQPHKLVLGEVGPRLRKPRAPVGPTLA
jgi:hypothetical protein